MVDHLVKVHCGTYILRDLGLCIYKKISSNMHELDKRPQVFLDRNMVEDDQSCALLRADSLVWVIQRRERSH